MHYCCRPDHQHHEDDQPSRSFVRESTSSSHGETINNLQMNPFIAFCLYVAARVFVQYLKSRREDSTVKSSLQFLLSAMQALKSQNPLTESFLVQLDVDLEGSGLALPANANRFRPAEKPRQVSSVHISRGATLTKDHRPKFL